MSFRFSRLDLLLGGILKYQLFIRAEIVLIVVAATSLFSAVGSVLKYKNLKTYPANSGQAGSTTAYRR